MGLFTSPGNTVRGSIPPRWPSSIAVAPVSGGTNIVSEEESTEYNQIVSGFGGMNPDESMLEGWCQVQFHILCFFINTCIYDLLTKYEVKMAGYWQSSSQSVKTQKKNLVNK